MANNKSIQLLRGSGANKTNILLDGQPYYDKTNKYLYIGDGTTQLKSLPALNLQGPTGPTGAKGDTGAQGPTGPIGATGPKGANGAGYTSFNTGSITISQINDNIISMSSTNVHYVTIRGYFSSDGSAILYATLINDSSTKIDSISKLNDFLDGIGGANVFVECTGGFKVSSSSDMLPVIGFYKKNSTDIYIRLLQ